MAKKLTDAHRYILNLLVDKGSRHRGWIAEMAKQKGFRVVNRSLNTLIERGFASLDEDDYVVITPAGAAAIGREDLFSEQSARDEPEAERIELRRNPDFGDKGLPDVHCAVCGKAVKKPKQFIHLVWGDTVVTEAEAQRIIASEGHGGDLLFFPIGDDCLKKHPELKPFIQRFSEKPAPDEPEAPLLLASRTDYGWSVKELDSQSPEAALSSEEADDILREAGYDPEQVGQEMAEFARQISAKSLTPEAPVDTIDAEREERDNRTGGELVFDTLVSTMDAIIDRNAEIARLNDFIRESNQLHDMELSSIRDGFTCALMPKHPDPDAERIRELRYNVEVSRLEREEREYQEVQAYWSQDNIRGLLVQIAQLQADLAALKIDRQQLSERHTALKAALYRIIDNALPDPNAVYDVAHVALVKDERASMDVAKKRSEPAAATDTLAENKRLTALVERFKSLVDLMVEVDGQYFVQNAFDEAREETTEAAIAYGEWLALMDSNSGVMAQYQRVGMYAPDEPAQAGDDALSGKVE